MNMRVMLLTIVFFTLWSCKDTKQLTSDYMVLTGATVFNGNGKTIRNSVVIIKDGKINEIGGKDLKIPDNAALVDLSGKYITPGLVDAHMHFAQTGFFDGRPDVVDIRDSVSFIALQTDLKANPNSYYEAYLRSGVTAVYDVGGFPWSIERQELAETNPNAPHIAAAGPLLSALPQERLDIFNTADDKQMVHLQSAKFGREAVRKYSDLGSTGIKVWGVPLADTTFMKGFKAVADEVKIQENKLIVHATSLDQAKEALRLGAKILVHSVENVAIDDEFIALAKANDVIYLPTLRVSRGYLNAFKSLKKKMQIADPNNVVDKRAKVFLNTSTEFYSFFGARDNFDESMEAFEQRVNATEEIMAKNLKRLFEENITIAVATDAGNPGTFHGISIYDEMEAMQKAGIPAIEIITMGTKNGAMAMDRVEDFGILKKGMMADLIVLEEDPSKDIANMRSITHVMRGANLRPVSAKFKDSMAIK